MAIVIDPPPLDDPPRVGQAEEPVLVQALVAQPAVEALDEGVLHGLARLDEAQRDPLLVGPLVERFARQLGPVVQHDLLRRLAALANHPAEHARHPHPPPPPESEVSPSIASDSRVKASTTVSMRIFRPQKRASLTKSKAQRWSGPVSAGVGQRSRATRFRQRRRSESPA